MGNAYPRCHSRKRTGISPLAGREPTASMAKLPVHGYTERDSGRVRTLLGYPTRCIVEQMEFQILLARLNAGDRADQQGMASWRFCRSPPHWVRRLPAPAEERLRPHLARRDLSHKQGSTLCRSRRRADSPARSSRRCNRNNLFRRLS